MLYNACLYGNYKQETKHKFINPQIVKYICITSKNRILYSLAQFRDSAFRDRTVQHANRLTLLSALRDIAQQHPNTTYIAHHQFHSHHHHPRARIPMCSLLRDSLHTDTEPLTKTHTHTFNCTHVVFAGSEHVCVCVCVKPATFVYIIYR